MGYTLDRFHTELRLDLKDSGTLWSDPELDRCVKLAVSDLSRHMPLERVHEYTINYTVTDESITSPATTSLSAVVAAQSINVAAGSLLTVAGQPDIPRPLTVTLVDANLSTYALSILITGMDENEQAQTEVFNWSRGDSLTIIGKKIFKTVYEVELDQDYGSGAGDTASVGYGLFTAKDVWVSLANKPIDPESETVTNAAGTTTYTRDTDYEMDYVNGRIHLVAGGSMAAATAYLVDYTKSRLGIDISAIIPELIRISNVEYPADQVPQQFVSYSIWGNFMYIGSKRSNQSQERISDKEHISIYYEREQLPPNTMSPGSYPEFMDSVVSVGAQAYALLMMALKYEHQAVTDMSTLKTMLTNTTAVHTLAKAALVLAGTQLNASVVAGLFTKVDVALDAISTVVGTMTTYLTGGSAPSVVKYLGDGDAYIDTLNIGSQVAQVYADYARVCDELATIISRQADAYTNEANVRLTESDRWYQAGMGFVAQANSYIQEIAYYLEEGSRLADAVNGDLVISDRFRTEGLNRMNDFQATLKAKTEWRRKVSRVALTQPS